MFSRNHSERIQFLVMSSPQAFLILGHLWLQIHNPQVDWVRSSFVERYILGMHRDTS